MEYPRRQADNTEPAAASSPYTANEKFGLRQQPVHSPISTPNVGGVPKEYAEHPLSYTDAGVKTIPVRKYSGQWWKKSWNKGIEGRIWPRVVYGAVFLVVMTVWLGGMIGFALDETNWAKKQENQLTRASAAGGLENQAPLTGMIGLKGALKSFDPVARNLAVEWSGYYKANAAADDQPIGAAGSGLFYPLNIYRDVSTFLYNFVNSSAPLPPDGTSFGTATDGTVITSLSSNTTADNINAAFPLFGQAMDYYYGAEGNLFWSQYVFRVDNASAPHVGLIGMHEWDSIDTDISFGPKDPKASAFKQPLFGYPFDEWQGTIVFVATDPWYEKLWNLSGIAAFPLSGAILSDNTLNWRFTVDYNSSCGSAIDRLHSSIEAGDLPRDNTFPLGDISIVDTFPCQLSVTINGGRPPLVKFAAVMAVIVNWTSTLFIFVMTCESLLMRRGYMLSGTDLLAINFTALFALPSVRLLLPGAPDFGIIIDLVGIIPNVIIISLCITAIAIAKLNRQKKTAKNHED